MDESALLSGRPLRAPRDLWSLGRGCPADIFRTNHLFAQAQYLVILKMPAISTTRKKPPQTYRFEAVIINSYYRGTTQIDKSSTFLMY